VRLYRLTEKDGQRIFDHPRRPAPGSCGLRAKALVICRYQLACAQSLLSSGIFGCAVVSAKHCASPILPAIIIANSLPHSSDGSVFFCQKLQYIITKPQLLLFYTAYPRFRLCYLDTFRPASPPHHTNSFDLSLRI
jgi:hypothetical protein